MRPDRVGRGSDSSLAEMSVSIVRSVIEPSCRATKPGTPGTAACTTSANSWSKTIASARSRSTTSRSCTGAKPVLQYSAAAPSFASAAVVSTKPQWLRHNTATVACSTYARFEKAVRQRVASSVQLVEGDRTALVDHCETVGKPVRGRGEAAGQRDPPAVQRYGARAPGGPAARVAACRSDAARARPRRPPPVPGCAPRVAHGKSGASTPLRAEPLHAPPIMSRPEPRVLAARADPRRRQGARPRVLPRRSAPGARREGLSARLLRLSPQGCCPGLVAAVEVAGLDTEFLHQRGRGVSSLADLAVDDDRCGRERVEFVA